MYSRLLVALDGSTEAERVLPHVEALATAFGSTVTLLRTCMSTEAVMAQTAGMGPDADDAIAVMDPTPIVDAERQAVIEYLDGISARLREHGITVTTEHPQGSAEDMIVERAAALSVDLVMMTTHGRSGLGRMFFGSVADSVLRHAACPVLLVRVTE
jgi:nucleotide-binding universal stress UspA family protein